MQNSTDSSLSSAVCSLYVLYTSSFFWGTEYMLSLDCVAGHKGQFNGFVLQLPCTISPGNRSWDWKKHPTYWANAMTDTAQLIGTFYTQICYAVQSQALSPLLLMIWLWALPSSSTERLFTQPLVLTAPVCLHEWPTSAVFALDPCGSIWLESISCLHSSVHTLLLPVRGKVMRKWLSREEILDKALPFHFPFVPCLWTEHKRKALSVPAGVSAIQVLGTT